MSMFDAFRRLFGRQPQALVTHGEGTQPRQYRIYVNPLAETGVFVDANTANRSDAFFAAKRYIAESIGKLPFRVKMTLPDGGSEIADRHPTDRVLNIRPNPNMSAMKFRETLITWAIDYGNGVAEIVRNPMGRVVRLNPIHPDYYEPEFDDAGNLVWRVMVPGQSGFYLRQEDAFHIPGYGDGVVGLSVVDYAAQTLGWQQAMRTFGAGYFARGAHPSGMLSLKDTLTESGFRLLKDQFKDKFQGVRRSHEPLVVDVPADFIKFSVAPEESQFVESTDRAIESIARWVGVPPSVIGHMKDAGVRANVEQESISVVTNCLHPWATRFETEGDYKFFSARDRYFCDIDLNRLMRGDMLTRANYYGVMQRTGNLSINEVRAEEGRGRVDGGDRHMVQGQMIDIRAVDGATSASGGGVVELPDAGPMPEVPAAQVDMDLPFRAPAGGYVHRGADLRPV